MGVSHHRRSTIRGHPTTFQTVSLGSLANGADNITPMGNGGPDAQLWVLLVIGLVTAAAAAYTLLTATGVLGGG